MLNLRPYRPEDAETIARWISDRDTMHRLAANLYDTFPVTGDMINRAYAQYKSTHNMVAFSVEDEAGILCGHFVYLFRNDDPDTARVCFVITDHARRGQGIGTEMVRIAVSHVLEVLEAKKVTLCVFANNPYAHQCYRTVGFRDLEPVQTVPIMGENWECIDMVYAPEEPVWN